MNSVQDAPCGKNITSRAADAIQTPTATHVVSRMQVAWCGHDSDSEFICWYSEGVHLLASLEVFWMLKLVR